MDRHTPPHGIDLHVGKRIRERRQLLGMSQTELGAHVGVSFQAVQKYENGLIRVSASRLAALAKTLQVQVSYFFEGIDQETSASAALDRLTIDMIQAAAGLPDDVREAFLRCMRNAAACGRKAPDEKDPK